MKKTHRGASQGSDLLVCGFYDRIVQERFCVSDASVQGVKRKM